jgi:hypothetical protein
MRWMRTTDSLANQPFLNVRLSDLWTVCLNVQQSGVNDIDFIRKRVKEKTIHFDEPLRLLVDLGVVRIKEHKILKGKYFIDNRNGLDHFRRELLARLFVKPGKYPQLADFLLAFSFDGTRISFKPQKGDRHRYSDVRDLLRDLGVIELSSSRTSYLLSEGAVELLPLLQGGRQMTPGQLKRRRRDQEKLGLRAELEVVRFERMRLKDKGIRANEIEHVSKTNVLAGFDIKSYEFPGEDHKTRLPRFIEVKAVSPSDWSFFWSRNEVAAAMLLRTYYYLYLVPVVGEGFDLKAMTIIPNAYAAVFGTEKNWEPTTESYWVTPNLSEQTRTE